MAKSQINENARTISIKAKSDKEFFLLHGYTGSPTDFNKLGQYLNKRFNANIKIIRFLGHGEKIENLEGIEYMEFYKQAEKELKKDLAKNKKIIIGGISMGSLISLDLASKYPVKGILNISIPYRKRFLTKIISIIEPLIIKKYWAKPMTQKEKELRKKAFYYDMSLLSFKVIRQGIREIKGKLKKIIAPCLVIHVKNDKLFSFRGARLISEEISSKQKKLVLFREGKGVSHNPFYSPNHRELPP